MKRLLATALLLMLVNSWSACGTFRVRGALNPATVSGTVSVVQLATAIENGTFVTITLVTFLQEGTSSTMNFCGDQRTQFPLDQFVQASFTPGPPCASVVEIIVVG